MSIIRSFSNDFERLCMQENKDMMIYDGYDQQHTYSYKEVWILIKRMLLFFEKKGIRQGDTIATILPNSPEAIVCFFAATIAGVNYAPLPCTVSEREHDNWKKLTKPIHYFIKKDVVEFEPDVECIWIETDGTFSWLQGEMVDEIPRKIEKSAKVFLLTSGTTGVPKAMQIDINKLWSAGYAFVSEYNILDSELRFWNYLPMSYLGGLFNLAFIPICCKGSFVISEPFSGKTMLNFWNFVKKYSIDALWFVPTIVRGLLKLYRIVGDKYNDVYRTIKIAFLGTAPIDNAVKIEFETKFDIKLFENFALSESTFLTGEMEDNIQYREQGSVGSKLSYVEIKFFPINTIDGINEIWIKTPFLFDGYLGIDGNLSLELDEEGFFNTKDLGFYNEDSQLVLCGRTRDIIKKGGLFVSLVEIENVVASYDGIEEVAAIPIAHEFYGEAYVLCVILKDKENSSIQIEKIRKKMMDDFVSYKLPEQIIEVQTFERTASGKIIKKKISDDML